MKIADFSPSSSYPQSVSAGAGNRIFNLNLELSKRCTVFQFSFMPSEYLSVKKTKLLKNLLRRRRIGAVQVPLRSRTVRISENYEEFTFASPFFMIPDYVLWRTRFGYRVPVFIPSFLDRTSVALARQRIAESDLVQVETPWPFDWVYKNLWRRKPVVLVEHDVQLREHQNRCRKEVLQKVTERERRALEKADGIFVVSEDDQEAIRREYGVEESKIHIVPNGVNPSDFKPSTEKEKEEIKSKFGFSNKTLVLFVGSNYLPNIEAVENIHHIASKVKEDDVLFLIAGSVGEYVRKRKTRNVYYTGYIDDIRPYFRMADIAVNARVSGGVANVKMLEYLASGLPVITSSFGAKGLRVQDKKHVLISSISQFAEKIEELVANKRKRMSLGREGRQIVERFYDWKVIAQKAMAAYGTLLRLG